jgi:hypothetical protein
MANEPTVQMQPTPDCLLVNAHGTMSLAWFLGLVRQIAQVVRDEPTKSVLVDVRGVVGSLSDVDRYDIGVAGASLGIRVPFAIVGMEPLIEPERLAEVVARNRGMNVRAFTDYEAASTWLQQQRAQAHPA